MMRNKRETIGKDILIKVDLLLISAGKAAIFVFISKLGDALNSNAGKLGL